VWLDHIIKPYNKNMKGFVKERSYECYDAHQANSATESTTSELNHLQRMAQDGSPFDTNPGNSH